MGDTVSKEHILETLRELDLSETARGEEFDLAMWAKFTDTYRGNGPVRS